MARASVFEKVRLGNESLTTPLPVAAQYVLPAAMVTATPIIPRNPIKTSGNKSNVGMTTDKQHSEADFSGPVTYCELPFFLNSILCQPTVVTASGATTLTWLPSTDSKDVLRTYTMEMGSSEGTAGFSRAFVNDLSFEFSKGVANLSGKIIGKVFQEGITLSSPVTTIALESASNDQVSIFVADTFAGLDDPQARLKGCLSSSFGLSDRQTPIFTLDDTEKSFTTTVEKHFEKSAQIVVIQDTQGAALMARLKANTVFYVRYVLRGREFVSGSNLEFTLTFPAMIKSTSRGDTDDAYTGSYDLDIQSVPGVFTNGVDSYLKATVKIPTASYTQSITAGTAPSGGNGVQVAADTFAVSQQI